MEQLLGLLAKTESGALLADFPKEGHLSIAPRSSSWILFPFHGPDKVACILYKQAGMCDPSPGSPITGREGSDVSDRNLICHFIISGHGLALGEPIVCDIIYFFGS